MSHLQWVCSHLIHTMMRMTGVDHQMGALLPTGEHLQRSSSYLERGITHTRSLVLTVSSTNTSIRPVGTCMNGTTSPSLRVVQELETLGGDCYPKCTKVGEGTPIHLFDVDCALVSLGHTCPSVYGPGHVIYGLSVHLYSFSSKLDPLPCTMVYVAIPKMLIPEYDRLEAQSKPQLGDHCTPPMCGYG
jgi:hypothetical protein